MDLLCQCGKLLWIYHIAEVENVRTPNSIGQTFMK